MKMLHRSIIQPVGKHTASLIFIHGFGDTGIGLQAWVEDLLERIGDKQGFSFNHIKVIYPTIPPRPRALIKEQMRNIERGGEELELMKWFGTVKNQLLEIIEEEKKSGIPAHRILLGGFSMGGSMSLGLGYTQCPDIKATFALSSFFNSGAKVFKSLKKAKEQGSKLPELFMCHGTKDSVVSYEWGEKTFKKLESLGVKGQFHSIDIFHEITSEELIVLRDWILEMIPEIPVSKL